MNGLREQWLPGQVAWFEYHCHEGWDSTDVPAWLRSHHQVLVLAEDDNDNPRAAHPTIADRGEAGMPVTYQVLFGDGLIWTAFEDELVDSPDHFYRPDPPVRR